MVNKKLKHLIDAMYPSQSACADALNWPRQKLNRYVLGQAVPTLEDTQALATVLNRPIGEMVNIFLP